MEEAFKSVALDTVKGLGLLAGSLVIFALIVMVIFRASARFGEGSGFRTAIGYAFPKEIYSRPSTRVDLALMTMRMFFILPVLGFIATLFLAMGIAQMLVAHFGMPAISVRSGGLTLAVQFAVAVLTGELGFYLFHRLSHQNRFFWTGHRPHHSAEQMTFLTGGRAHPLDDVGFIFVAGLLIAAPLNAVGLYFTGVTPHHLLPTLSLAYAMFGAVADKFNHSHIPTSFGPLNYLFISGHMHQIHHSAELRHRDKNFGGTLAVFDWIFGTLYIPKPGEVPRLGLSEDSLGKNNPHKSLKDCLLEPLFYLVAQFSRQNRK